METHSVVRAEIEEDFKSCDPAIGKAVLCLYEARWILQDRMPALAPLPEVMIGEIRDALGIH